MCFDAFSSKNGYETTFTNDYGQGCFIVFECRSFTGKEKDAETGYGYFGARYMDYELMTMWLTVDPLADKYPSISPYAYCVWNPVKLVDPDGRMIDDYKIFRDGTITIAKTNDPYDRFFVEQSDGTFGVVEMKKHLVGAGRNAGKDHSGQGVAVHGAGSIP